MFQLIEFSLKLMSLTPVAVALVLWLSFTFTDIAKFIIEVLITEMGTEYCTSYVSVATLYGNQGLS